MLFYHYGSFNLVFAFYSAMMVVMAFCKHHVFLKFFLNYSAGMVFIWCYATLFPLFVIVCNGPFPINDEKHVLLSTFNI